MTSRFSHSDAGLRARYRISRAQYEALLEQQGGLCAACRELGTMKPSGRHPSLVVDHHHASGAVRGLLCYRCNIMLGWLETTEPATIDRLVRMRNLDPAVVAIQPADLLPPAEVRPRPLGRPNPSLREQIIGALQDGVERKPREIASLTGIRVEAVRVTLSRAWNGGHLVRTEQGSYTLPGAERNTVAQRLRVGATPLTDIRGVAPPQGITTAEKETILETPSDPGWAAMFPPDWVQLFGFQAGAS